MVKVKEKRSENREKHHGFKMTKALLRTIYCTCWNVCSIICQLWNFKARIKRCSKCSTYMTPLYFSFSESLTVLLAQNPMNVAITFLPSKLSVLAREPGGGSAVAGTGPGGTAEEHTGHQTRDTGSSHQAPPSLVTTFCKLFFETQVNTKLIQENKVWYFYLDSFKAALGCRPSWKMSFIFLSWII